MSQRYWIMRDHKLEGPYDLEGLNKLSGFTIKTLLCREGEDVWEPASEALKIRIKPVKWSPYGATSAMSTSSVAKPPSKPSAPSAPAAPSAPVVPFPAPVAVAMDQRFSGDFAPPPEMRYVGPSGRLWFLFICLSVINSLYWGYAHLPGGLVLTIPISAEYLPPIIHRVAKKLPAALAPATPLPDKKKAAPHRAARASHKARRT